MNNNMILALGLLSTTLFAGGCSHSAVPAAPVGQAPAAASAPEMEAKKQTDVATQAQISISDEIKQACHISDPDAYFAFDSARLTDQDNRVVGELADCFSNGPMKGKTMRLVGHTDPRGDAEYNMVLGQNRADNVKHILVEKGLSAERIQTSSRGKMDAKGHDEAAWALDRRVDVLAGG